MTALNRQECEAWRDVFATAHVGYSDRYEAGYKAALLPVIR